MSACDAQCTHADDIERNRWGWPLVDGTPYPRVSTVAKTLDDQGNLIDWSGGMVAVGMALPASVDLREAALLHRGDNKALKKVQRDAKDRAGASVPAGRGTNLHEVVHRIVQGVDPGELSDATRASVEALFDAFAREGLKVLATEQFVVNTDAGVAGTFDMLLEDAGGKRYIGDLKTGAKSWERQFPGAVSVQLASYQGGRRWCPHEGWLPEHLAEADTALLVSLPVDKGECFIDAIDLEAGRYGLELALKVRNWRKTKPIAVYRGTP